MSEFHSFIYHPPFFTLLLSISFYTETSLVNSLFVLTCSVILPQFFNSFLFFLVSEITFPVLKEFFSSNSLLVLNSLVWFDNITILASFFCKLFSLLSWEFFFSSIFRCCFMCSRAFIISDENSAHIPSVFTFKFHQHHCAFFIFILLSVHRSLTWAWIFSLLKILAIIFSNIVFTFLFFRNYK